MHHAQIAQRAFDTPLMIAPAKALAFLAGLGPRITGQEIRFDGMTVAEPDLTATRQTAFASLIFGFFFYWTARPDFPPAGADHPEGLWVALCAALLVLAWLAIVTARETNVRGYQGVARLALCLARLRVLAHLGDAEREPRHFLVQRRHLLLRRGVLRPPACDTGACGARPDGTIAPEHCPCPDQHE